MRKLAALVLVLGLAATANADMKITVNGVVDPQNPIYVTPSTWLTIGIYNIDQEHVFMGLMSITGGSYDITGATNSINPPGYPDSIFEIEPGQILIDLFIFGSPGPPPLPSGQLVDQILVHPDGPGDMTITFLDDDPDIIFDTQIIHVPEPMTLALLGLGGLLLRKRS